MDFINIILMLFFFVCTYFYGVPCLLYNLLQYVLILLLCVHMCVCMYACVCTH
jgi:hypothetical protein